MDLLPCQLDPFHLEPALALLVSRARQILARWFRAIDHETDPLPRGPRARRPRRLATSHPRLDPQPGPPLPGRINTGRCPARTTRARARPG